MQEDKARFPRSVRLLTPSAFRRVFQKARRSSDNCFTVLYLANQSQQARLGLAVAKKVLKRAVDRNLVKRIARESFRHHQYELSGYDLVILCKRGIPLADKAVLRNSLKRHWERVAEDKNS